MAAIKMRRGQSTSMNTWLRARIIAQGATVAAVVAGSWAYGSAVPPRAVQEDTAAAKAKTEENRRAFEERMREAEKAEARERGVPVPVEAGSTSQSAAPEAKGATSGASWWSWSRWTGSGSAKGAQPLTAPEKAPQASPEKPEKPAPASEKTTTK